MCVCVRVRACVCVCVCVCMFAGVDDNGAAVVTMLQAARVLSQHPKRDYTVLFIAFDFEEWEAKGQSPLLPLPLSLSIFVSRHVSLCLSLSPF